MNPFRGLLPILIFSAFSLKAVAVTPDGTSSAAATDLSRADSVATALHFRIGQSTVIPAYGENASSLDTILRAIEQYSAMGSDFSVDIIGLSSPDGGRARNLQLANERSENSRSIIESRIPGTPDIKFTLRNGGINWKGLRVLLQAVPDFEGRDEALALLTDILPDGSLPEASIEQLKHLKNGQVWSRLYSNFFPDLRKALVTVYPPPRLGRPSGLITVHEVPSDTTTGEPGAEYAAATDTVTTVETEVIEIVEPLADATASVPQSGQSRPMYMSLSTNVLYDAALLPNIVIEFYLGKNWSINGDWLYGWWDSNKRHRYWRAYGGDIGVRYWFGKAARRKPLTGHHIGVYGQMLLYDFEFGGKGQMGGKPGGNIWEKSNYGASVEYGFSLPVGRRLNIDFTLGVGYLGGEYYEYRPEDGHYVWLRTKKRRWFGPTKAQISLVWLLGRGNTNKKGGMQ